MERLTENIGFLRACTSCPMNSADCCNATVCGKIRDAMNRLVQYERSGLTPKDVQEMKKEWTAYRLASKKKAGG